MRLVVALADTCNLKCTMCSFRKTMSGKRMPKDKFRDILEQSKSAILLGERVEHIRLDGNREVLGLPDIADSVYETKQAGFKAHIMTNAALLTQQKSRDLLDAGLDYLRVSVTGLTPDVYKNYQGSGQTPEDVERLLETVIQNMRYITRLKKERNHSIKIGITYVLTKETAPFAREALFFWKDMGVDQVSFTHLFLDLNPDEFDSTPHIKNRACVFRPSIGANGDVYRCCTSYGEEDYILGNAFETPLEEIFRSEKVQRLMRALGRFDGDTLPMGCKKCFLISDKNRIAM